MAYLRWRSNALKVTEPLQESLSLNQLAGAVDERVHEPAGLTAKRGMGESQEGESKTADINAAIKNTLEAFVIDAREVSTSVDADCRPVIVLELHSNK